jgi:hypothetical protein
MIPVKRKTIMTTESEVKLARYSEVIKTPDAFDRVIGVRRLKPSEQTKLSGMTPELTGYDEATNDKGEPIRIPHRMPLVVAAAVCYISDSQGEAHISFPRNRGELDAIYDRLDGEGIKAAGNGFGKLMSADIAAAAVADSDIPVDPLAESKN